MLRNRWRVAGSQKLHGCMWGFKRPSAAYPPPEAEELDSHVLLIEYDWRECHPATIALKAPSSDHAAMVGTVAGPDAFSAGALGAAEEGQEPALAAPAAQSASGAKESNPTAWAVSRRGSPAPSPHASTFAARRQLTIARVAHADVAAGRLARLPDHILRAVPKEQRSGTRYAKLDGIRRSSADGDEADDRAHHNDRLSRSRKLNLSVETSLDKLRPPAEQTDEEEAPPPQEPASAASLEDPAVASSALAVAEMIDPAPRGILVAQGTVRALHWVAITLQLLTTALVFFPLAVDVDPWSAKCETCVMRDYDIFQAAFHHLAIALALPAMNWTYVRFGYYLFDRQWRNTSWSHCKPVAARLSLLWAIAFVTVGALRLWGDDSRGAAAEFAIALGVEVMAWIALSVFVACMVWGTGQHTDHERTLNAMSCVPLVEFVALWRADDRPTSNVLLRTFRRLCLVQIPLQDIPFICILSASLAYRPSEHTALKAAALALTVVLFLARTYFNYGRLREWITGGEEAAVSAVRTIALFPFQAIIYLARRFDRETAGDVERFHRHRKHRSDGMLNWELERYRPTNHKQRHADRFGTMAHSQRNESHLHGRNAEGKEKIRRSAARMHGASTHALDVAIGGHNPVLPLQRATSFLWRILFLANLASDVVLLAALAPSPFILSDIPWWRDTDALLTMLVVVIVALAIAATFAIPIVVFMQTQTGITQFVWLGLVGCVGSAAGMFVCALAEPGSRVFLAFAIWGLTALAAMPVLLAVRHGKYRMGEHGMRLMKTELVAGVAGTLPLLDLAIVAAVRQYRTWKFMYRVQASQERWLFFAQDVPMLIVLSVYISRADGDANLAAYFSIAFTSIHILIRGFQVLRYIHRRLASRNLVRHFLHAERVEEDVVDDDAERAAERKRIRLARRAMREQKAADEEV